MNEQNILIILRPWQEEIYKIGDREFGRTKVFFVENKLYKLGECNLDNFITYDFVDYVSMYMMDNYPFSIPIYLQVKIIEHMGLFQWPTLDGLRTSLTLGGKGTIMMTTIPKY